MGEDNSQEKEFNFSHNFVEDHALSQNNLNLRIKTEPVTVRVDATVYYCVQYGFLARIVCRASV